MQRRQQIEQLFEISQINTSIVGAGWRGMAFAEQNDLSPRRLALARWSRASQAEEKAIRFAQDFARLPRH